jgi:butyryl-CoA dehydrogenase
MTEERELMRNVARDFVESEVKPVALELDKKDEFPLKLMKRAGELGFLGITFPEEFGGLGGDWTTLALVNEEICKVAPTLSVVMGAHSVLAGGMLNMLGSQQQKEKYLIPAAKGEIILAMAGTEAAGGANYKEFVSSAVLDGDEWVINGTKLFITNINYADVYIVVALTSLPGTPPGLNMFLVEKGTPGLEPGNAENKMGWNGSSTGSVYLRNCRVPKENMLGSMNKVMLPFYFSASDEFMMCGAMGLGMAEACYDMAFKYCHERMQSGRSMYDKYQVTRHKLVNMWIEIEALRAFLYSTTALRDKGELTLAAGRALKIKGAKVAEYVASEAIQIHGGVGTIIDTGIERFWRDAKVMFIGGGSLEALSDDIASINNRQSK